MVMQFVTRDTTALPGMCFVSQEKIALPKTCTLHNKMSELGIYSMIECNNFFGVIMSYIFTVIGHTGYSIRQYNVNVPFS